MNNYFNGNGTVGFTCDACGRETHSCSYVNEDIKITPPCIEFERYVVCPFCKAYNKL